MISIALTALLLRGPDLTKHVTYETVAVPVTKAIQGIAKATGEKLLASDEMASDIVILHLSDVPLSEALPKIAKATSGRWVEQPGTYVLIADSSVRQEEEEAAFKKRVQNISDGIKQRLKMNDMIVEAAKEAATPPGPKKGTGDQESAAPAVAPENNSREQLLESILGALDAVELASIADGGRLVFSSNPTPMQKPLGGLRPELVAQFVKDHNAAVAKSKAEKKDQGEAQDSQAAEAAKQLSNLFGSSEIAQDQEIKAAPSKILLGATREAPMAGMISLDLLLFDNDGKVVYTDRDFISEHTGLPGLAETTVTKGEGDNEKKQTQKEPPGKPIEFSPTSKALAKLFSGPDVFGGKMPQISTELMEKLLHPDEFDPLSFAPSEAMLALAKDRSEQLVAEIPDSSFDRLASGSAKADKGTMTTGEFMESLKSSDAHIEVQDAKGWLEVTLEDRFTTRKERMDRAAITEFVQAAHSKGVASLDDYANLAVRTPPMTMDGPAIFYIVFAGGGGIMSSFAGVGNWEMLRFYGLLSQDQRAMLQNGRKLRIADLSGDQGNTVHSMVYGAHPGLAVATPEAPPKPKLDIPFMEMAGGFANPISNYLQEPTESMPGGLPGDALIGLNVTGQTIVSPSGTSGITQLIGPLGPQEYSLFDSIGESPAAQAMATVFPKFDKFRVGARRNLIFTFQFSQVLSMQKSLKDDSVPKDAPEVAKGNLPGDFLKQAEDFKKATKGLFDISNFFGGGRNQPPPQ